MFDDRPARDTTFKWDARTIRALRTFLAWSQSALARELGIRQQTVSEWETGMYRPRGASVTILSLLARTAGFNPSVALHAAERQSRGSASPHARSGIGLMNAAPATGPAPLRGTPSSPSNSVDRSPASGGWQIGPGQYSDDLRARGHTEGRRFSRGDEVPM
jgi:DNA-binding XRE family transcriptional regulator